LSIIGPDTKDAKNFGLAVARKISLDQSENDRRVWLERDGPRNQQRGERQQANTS
jgi:hypothetical protein